MTSAPPPSGRRVRTSDSPTAIGLPDITRAVSIASSPTLLVTHPRGSIVLPLGRDPVVLGRGSDADVCISDPMLSRKHARFSLVGDGLWVEDLESKNGTFLVGGDRVPAGGVATTDPVECGTATVCLIQAGPGGRFLEKQEQFVAALERLCRECDSVGVFTYEAPEGATILPIIPWAQRLLTPDGFLWAESAASLRGCVGSASRADCIAIGYEVVSRQPDPRLRIRCGISMKAGADWRAGALLDASGRAAREATEAAPVYCVAEPQPAAGIPTASLITRDERMSELVALANRAAHSSIPVLVLGETGSGKELIARLLHESGPRRDRALRSINCAAIPPTLVESIFFGHVQGAFTGANRNATGIFEQADGGTVFLDEIGELGANAQAALLRVLETKNVEKVGAARGVHIDVRVVAATHRNLEEMCKNGEFRTDLFYRLNALVLDVPPLRERPSDIEPLALHFLALGTPEGGRTSHVRAIDRRALALLQRYAWPGNVRELKLVIERCLVVANGALITADDLPERVRQETPRREPLPEDEDVPSIDLKQRVREYETDLIVAALRQCGGNRSRAAEYLGIPVRTLHYKMRLYEIDQRK